MKLAHPIYISHLSAMVDPSQTALHIPCSKLGMDARWQMGLASYFIRVLIKEITLDFFLRITTRKNVYRISFDQQGLRGPWQTVFGFVISESQ